MSIKVGINGFGRIGRMVFRASGHRRNILRSGFSSIGVCAVEYNGIMYWVQLFGK